MDFRCLIEARFRPDAAANVDAVFALATPRAPLLTFAVRAGELAFEEDTEPDVTFTFDQPETARKIIAGEADPIAAFMAGRFRSDGNLPLAFVLLGLFRQDFAGPPPP